MNIEIYDDIKTWRQWCRHWRKEGRNWRRKKREDETKKTQEEALRRHRKIRQCGEAFTRRSFYTQNPLHTEPFTHRTLYTQTPLHTGTFTHRGFYTQALVDVSHTDAHTQKLLQHRCFTHRSFYAQKLLHTDAFTHRRFHGWVPTLHLPNQLTSFETNYIAISRQLQSNLVPCMTLSRKCRRNNCLCLNVCQAEFHVYKGAISQLDDDNVCCSNFIHKVEIGCYTCDMDEAKCGKLRLSFETKVKLRNEVKQWKSMEKPLPQTWKLKCLVSHNNLTAGNYFETSLDLETRSGCFG